MDYLFTWHQEVVGEPKENSGPHRGTVFVVLISISMVFLAIYGSQRRRRRSFIAQRFVRVAYLSSSLITYIHTWFDAVFPSEEQHVPLLGRISLHPIWFCCLLYHSLQSR